MDDEPGGFELRVATPVGWANWDVLVYRPSHTYPDEMYGGTVQRFGDWAYVHE
ncbi:MAG: hypothetical protein IH998_15425 [Proteobacteria bacterium]|nr:hypothetical protein [Pseudomonadota bacterium]